MKNTTYKLGLAAVAALAVTLSACSDKGAATTEDDPTLDAQTQVEQEATGVDDVAQVTEGVNSADISDDPMVGDDVAVASADDDVAVATVDDADVLDGSESEEHISTY
ncbi:MAG: hypothetical protein ACR2PP_03620 [Psychrobacter sp.]|mgnify:FL=1